MVHTWCLPKYRNVYLALLVLLVFFVHVYLYICTSARFNALLTAIPQKLNNDIDIWRKLVKQYMAKQEAKEIEQKTVESCLNSNEWNSLMPKSGKIPTTYIVTNYSDDKANDIHLNSNTRPMQHFLKQSIQLMTKDELVTSSTAVVLLVLFTTFDDNAEKYVCRNNTLRNWKSFGAFVKPVFFTENDNLAKRVTEKGWDVLSPSKTMIGIPVLKYMFLDVMKKYPALFYAYANGDILFVDNLIGTLMFMLNSNFNQNSPMLIVGRRTNVESVTEEQASTHGNIILASKKGKLFMPDAEDYFISNRKYPWSDIPDVVVGRPAYDNWFMLNARKQNHITIDASNTILALHQTTKPGNLERHSHRDKYFNKTLLRVLFNKINYYSGLTSCIPIYTIYNITNNHMQLQKRKEC